MIKFMKYWKLDNKIRENNWMKKYIKLFKLDGKICKIKLE